MNIFTIFAFLIFSVVAFSQEKPIKLPEVRCDTSVDGFCDISLTVEQKNIAQDGTLTITVAGAHKNEVLEMQIAIAAGMKHGDMNPVTGAPQPYSVERGGVRLKRSGEASDRLVARIADLYQVKYRAKAMDDDIHFSTFAFRGDPEKIATQEVLFELFHDDPANKVPQCELLLDVNLPANEIKIREKNQDFRDCVVRILSNSE